MTDTTTPVQDAMERGIREWHDLKARTAAAEAAREKAERDAEYHRGRCEEMTRQAAEDRSTIERLLGQVKEAEMHMGAFGAMVLDYMEKAQLGPYRAPGSRKSPAIATTAERLAQGDIVGADAIDEHMKDLVGRMGRNVEGTT